MFPNLINAAGRGATNTGARTDRHERSLRLAGETETEFIHRIKRTARLAQVLIEACLGNKCVQAYLADPAIPFYTEEALKASPIVRVEFEQAIAIGGIGETLDATRSKSWGDGPYILPLQTDDWFYAERITYLYRENSLYNRRFEQRKRLKELLGKRWRKLVEEAKWHTKTIFLRDLTTDHARAIRRNIRVEPGEFWRAAQGKIFLDLPPRIIQQEFNFEEIEGVGG